MKSSLITLIKVIILLIPISSFAQAFQASSSYETCFTPAQKCTYYITSEINRAQKTILVQAYSFTSNEILGALKSAHDRGVQVKVILDKGQYKPGTYRSSTYLTNNGIATWIDEKVAIQHNKVMIIDGETVITGSFNFTNAADKRNAENLLLIRDAALARAYTENWERRRVVSLLLGIL